MGVECILNFEGKPQQSLSKQPMYRSKYDHRTPLIGSTFCMHGTTAVDGKGFHSLKQVRFLTRMDDVMRQSFASKRILLICFSDRTTL